MEYFKCVECEKVFSQKNNLSRHVRNIHERVTSNCSKCDKVFIRDHLRRQHEAVCTGKSSQVSNSQGGVCDVCGKFFKRVCDLNRHKHSVHEGIKFACSQCEKSFSRNSDRVKHELNCKPISNTYSCANCSAKCSTLRDLEEHALVHQRKREATAAAQGPSAKRPRADYVQCRRCTDRFQNRGELHAHNMAVHFQVGDGSLQAAPWGTESPPWIYENGDIDEALETCYNTNRPLILAQHETGPVKSVFNIPVSPDMTITDIGRALLEIYQRQTHAFRVNITFGMILRHIETGELSYFRPFSNQAIFDAPCFIAKRSDLAEIIQKLKDMDIMHQLLKNLPDTKWRLEIITNMRFEVFCTNYVLGVSRTPLPSHVTYSRSIISLEKDTHDLVYRDNLCAFRCMSLHKYNDLIHTSELFVQWKEYLFSNCDEDIREVSLKYFKGVQLTQLTHFESCFRTNIHVSNMASIPFRDNAVLSNSAH